MLIHLTILQKFSFQFLRVLSQSIKRSLNQKELNMMYKLCKGCLGWVKQVTIWLVPEHILCLAGNPTTWVFSRIAVLMWWWADVRDFCSIFTFEDRDTHTFTWWEKSVNVNIDHITKNARKDLSSFYHWLFCLLHTNLGHIKGLKEMFPCFEVSKNENFPLRRTYLQINNFIEGQLEK